MCTVGRALATAGRCDLAEGASGASTVEEQASRHLLGARGRDVRFCGHGGWWSCRAAAEPAAALERVPARRGRIRDAERIDDDDAGSGGAIAREHDDAC